MTENFFILIDYARQVLRHLLTLHRLAMTGYGMLALPVMLLLTACRGKPEKQAQPPRPVRTILTPPPAVVSAFTQTGEIRPQDEVSLGFRFDGRLLIRRVDIGDHVEAGQELGTLENNTNQNQLDGARADLDSTLAAERLAALNLKRMRVSASCAREKTSSLGRAANEPIILKTEV